MLALALYCIGRVFESFGRQMIRCYLEISVLLHIKVEPWEVGRHVDGASRRESSHSERRRRNVISKKHAPEPEEKELRLLVHRFKFQRPKLKRYCVLMNQHQRREQH
jgi:hypothetical protein